MKGIIFDFNGTLFYDTPLHIDAWREYSAKLRGTPFDDKEMLEHMVGHTNADIIEYALGKKPDEQTVVKFAAEKEAVYRDMCMKKTEIVKLADGAEDFLNFLKKKNVPFTIATGSDKENVDFFIEIFYLEKWFDISKIVYDDGTMKGKPAPDMYLKAAEVLDLSPKDCLVVEDAIAGIESAKNAGIGMIVAITQHDKKDFYKNIEGVDIVITNFNELKFLYS